MKYTMNKKNKKFTFDSSTSYENYKKQHMKKLITILGCTALILITTILVVVFV